MLPESLDRGRTGPGSVQTSLAGELDGATTPSALCRLKAVIDDNPGTQVVVDMSTVSFIDGFGLSMICGARREALDLGGDLCLEDVGSTTTRLLALTGLDRLLLAVLGLP